MQNKLITVDTVHGYCLNKAYGKEVKLKRTEMGSSAR